MSRDVKDPKFRLWTGVLPIKQYAALFHDEVYLMLTEDPVGPSGKRWIDRRRVEEAQEMYEVIMGWPEPIRTDVYSWLRSNL